MRRARARRKRSTRSRLRPTVPSNRPQNSRCARRRAAASPRPSARPAPWADAPPAVLRARVPSPVLTSWRRTTLRASETANARNQLTAALGGVRGQDVETAAKNADLNQAANANNLNSQLQQNELAEKQRQALIDAQLKALGIGTQASSSILNAGAANANADNKQKGGILDTVGNLL